MAKKKIMAVVMHDNFSFSYGAYKFFDLMIQVWEVSCLLWWSRGREES